MKFFLKFLLCIFAVIFVVWGLSILKCEYLTMRYGDEFDFESVRNSNTLMPEVEFFKVLSYDQNRAEIYYVGENFSVGEILKFEKDGEIWVHDSWDTIWTALGGSADASIWPYFWHNWQYVLMRKIEVNEANSSFSHFWIEDDKVYLQCEVEVYSNLEHNIRIVANFSEDEGKLLKKCRVYGYDKDLKSDCFHVKSGTNKFTVIFVGDYGGNPQKADKDFDSMKASPYTR